MDHRVAATDGHALDDLVIRKDCAELRTPVDHHVAKVGDTIVHQDVELLIFALGIPLIGGEREFLGLRGVDIGCSELGEVLGEDLYRSGLVELSVIERAEHLLERPLSPLIIVGRAGSDLTAPVEAEADLVELLAIALDVILCGDGGVLACLNGILLGRESIGVITHGVKHVEAIETLEARIDV